MKGPDSDRSNRHVCSILFRLCVNNYVIDYLSIIAITINFDAGLGTAGVDEVLPWKQSDMPLHPMWLGQCLSICQSEGYGICEAVDVQSDKYPPFGKLRRFSMTWGRFFG
jgi:hypothetical protein